MNIYNTLDKIKSYDKETSELIDIIDNEGFGKELISKTADFIKDNFDIKNIYICEKKESFIILRNSKYNPFFKINIDSAQNDNLPFSINLINHPLAIEHNCPLKSSDGIPAICLPIKKLAIKKDNKDENYESYLQLQFNTNIKLDEEKSLLLSHIALTMQRAYQYHSKASQLGKNFNTISREYKQFIHFVSHDLKSPITAILGFIAIINDENIKEYSEDFKHYIERISVNAKIINNMINDMLYISRLEKTEEEKIDIHELIVESIVPLQQSINNKGLNIMIEENLPKIFANRSHIKKLFQLILENSIKFTEDGGWINIGYRNKEFYISDNGIGIKDNNLEKVFRIFYSTCEKKENHTGTGLYIAKKIVELYNGEIRIESKYGKGTTVYFTLPIKY